MPQVRVETLTVGPVQTNCYLIENPETGDVIVIDPGDEGAKIIRAIGERPVAAVLLTHGHFDHIGALDDICGYFGASAYIHEADAGKLSDPVANESVGFGQRVAVATLPQTLQNGQVLTLGGMKVELLHTPGHSRGSSCYLVEGDQCIFCGDTLFDGGYGRYDFADSSFAQLKASLRTLIHLHPKRIAYPGHGGTTFAGRDGEAQG